MSIETGRLRVVGPEGTPSTAPEQPDETVAPGEYIRGHRERRGMSIEQLAAATKIPRASLELLEEGRFDQLPGPVFVRGFLRCCARTLQLDPQHVIELLYEQERALTKAARREASATGKHAPARASKEASQTPAASPRAPAAAQPAGWLRERLSATNLVLWLLVVVVVALLVLAAFHLAGGGDAAVPHT